MNYSTSCPCALLRYKATNKFEINCLPQSIASTVSFATRLRNEGMELSV